MSETPTKLRLHTTTSDGLVFLHGTDTYRMSPSDARNLGNSLLIRAEEAEGKALVEERYRRTVSAHASWTQLAFGVSYDPEEGHLCIIFPFLTIFVALGKST